MPASEQKKDLNAALNSCFQVKNNNRSAGPPSAGGIWDFVKQPKSQLVITSWNKSCQCSSKPEVDGELSSSQSGPLAFWVRTTKNCKLGNA